MSNLMKEVEKIHGEIKKEIQRCTSKAKSRTCTEEERDRYRAVSRELSKYHSALVSACKREQQREADIVRQRLGEPEAGQHNGICPPPGD